MKAFETLTEQELVELSEDAIQRYIDYACANNGVALLPVLLPAPPESVTPQADAMVYSVGTMYSPDIVCVHLADAQRLAEVLNGMFTCGLDYIPGPSTERAIAPKRGPYIVTPTPVFSEALAATIRPALQDAERAKKVYADAKKEHDQIISERAAYHDDIREAVSAAWTVHRRREELRRAYDRYLDLANGQPEIAARFLSNAYRDAETLLPDLYPTVDDMPSPEPVTA